MMRQAQRMSNPYIAGNLAMRPMEMFAIAFGAGGGER